MALPHAFDALRDERYWVAWNDEGGRKVPKSPFGGNARSNDPSTWGTYDEAAAAASRNGYSGVGLMLSDGYIGIDLDGAIDEDGNIEPWAQEIVGELGSYAERSPSGRGIHVLAWADMGQVGPIGRADHRAGIEVYNHGRYFTVTGDEVSGGRIYDLTEEMPRFVASRFSGESPEQSVRRRVGDLASAEVKRMANRTMTDNCVRDGVRYARVPVGAETCGFCIMLASRGFVYHSERTAGELNHYHANCVLPETNLGSVGARACLRRKYEGVVCHISTRGGRHLSVTPNHPVLTVRGWVDACHLEDGDALLCRVGGNREEVGVPEVDKTPACADEVFEALRLLLATVGYRVPATSVDFDGEPVSDGDVEVVDVNGLLEGDVVPAGHERLCDNTLAPAGLLDRCGVLDGSGSLDLLRDGSMPAARGVMGCGCLLGSLLGSHFGSSDDSSIGASAKLAASLFEPPCDCWSADGVDARELEHARSVLVSLYKAGRCGEALASRLDTAALQDVKNGVVGYPELFGDFGCLHSGGVEIDHVSVVRHSSFVGHVYNLSTDGGWYFANDIIVHNCDCKVIPGFPGLEVEGYDIDSLYDLYAEARSRAEHPTGADISREIERILAERSDVGGGFSSGIDRGWFDQFDPEQMWLRSSNGKVLHKTGDQLSVPITHDEMRAYHGGSALHTHTTSIGGTFSVDDVEATVAMALVEHRLSDTAHSRRFALRRTAATTDELSEAFSSDYGAFVDSSFEDALYEAWRRNSEPLGIPATSEDYIEAEAAIRPLMDEWLADNAVKYGYEYVSEDGVWEVMS